MTNDSSICCLFVCLFSRVLRRLDQLFVKITEQWELSHRLSRSLHAITKDNMTYFHSTIASFRRSVLVASLTKAIAKLIKETPCVIVLTTQYGLFQKHDKLQDSIPTTTKEAEQLRLRSTNRLICYSSQNRTKGSSRVTPS